MSLQGELNAIHLKVRDIIIDSNNRTQEGPESLREFHRGRLAAAVEIAEAANKKDGIK